MKRPPLTLVSKKGHSTAPFAFIYRTGTVFISVYLIVSPGTADLSHKTPASAGTFHDSCGVKGQDKRGTSYCDNINIRILMLYIQGCIQVILQLTDIRLWYRIYPRLTNFVFMIITALPSFQRQRCCPKAGPVFVSALYISMIRSGYSTYTELYT